MNKKHNNKNGQSEELWWISHKDNPFQNKDKIAKIAPKYVHESANKHIRWCLSYHDFVNRIRDNNIPKVVVFVSTKDDKVSFESFAHILREICEMRNVKIPQFSTKLMTNKEQALKVQRILTKAIKDLNDI